MRAPLHSQGLCRGERAPGGGQVTPLPGSWRPSPALGVADPLRPPQCYRPFLDVLLAAFPFLARNEPPLAQRGVGLCGAAVLSRRAFPLGPRPAHTPECKLAAVRRR